MAKTLGFLPDRSNQETHGVDGRVRFCPYCNEVLTQYVVTKSSKEASRTLEGFYCVECDFVCLNRRALNDAISKLA